MTTKFTFEDRSQKGQPNGYAPLVDGVVPDDNLPGLVHYGDNAGGQVEGIFPTSLTVPGLAALEEEIGRSSGVAATNAAGIPLYGLQCWLDAADRSSLSLNGSNVTQILDRSGNGQHFSGTGTITVSSEAKNGLDVIVAGGGTLHATIPAALNFLHSTQSTVFAFAKGDSLLNFLDSRAGINEFDHGYDFRITTSGFSSLVTSSNGFVLETDVVSVTHDYHAYVLGLDLGASASGRAKLFIDGIDQTITNTASNAAVGGNADFPLHLFGASGIESGWGGEFGELLIYDRLMSTAEIVGISSYLHSKWATYPIRDLTGSVDPTSSGVAANIGDRYTRLTDGALYSKTGSGDTNWTAR